MKYIPILFALLFASCAPKAIPTARIVPVPQSVARVAPRAAVVHSKVEAAAVTSADLRTGIQRAMEEADRLRKQKTASEAELTNMWSILTKEKEAAANLFNQLESARGEAAKLAADAVFKDVEVDQLRIANQTLSNQVEQATKNEQIHQKKTEKLSKKAAVYDFFRTWVLWILAIVLVGAIIRFAIPIITRAIKPV